MPFFHIFLLEVNIPGRIDGLALIPEFEMKMFSCGKLAGIANKGYSASLFCNQIGAEGGQQIVEETLAILNEMKAKDEQ